METAIAKKRKTIKKAIKTELKSIIDTTIAQRKAVENEAENHLKNKQVKIDNAQTYDEYIKLTYEYEAYELRLD